MITNLPVYSVTEYGAQGIALDPDFEENNWIYLYYTPPHPDVPEGEAPDRADDPSEFDEWQGHNHLSRFEFVDGDEPEIDLDSDEVLLEVPQNLGMCCHLGGDIDFDSEGNLYLSTGDDTSAFESDDFTPIDEREISNPGFDAQRTSANTASMSGKLLRITPEDDGSYSIPDANMFVSARTTSCFPTATTTRNWPSEIYAMGLRNPFRFSIDPVTDHIYLGDYGPDAPEADPDRGPEATVSWHIITEPMNAGWPHCIGDNVAYVDYDVETEESGEEFDCEGGPVNDSPRNDGLEQTPPVTPAEVWDFNSSTPEEFPELGEEGGAPMGGPVYRYDEDATGDGQFPEFYDGTAFFYEWNQDFIKRFTLTDDGTALDVIRDFVPDWEFSAPMDMEFGPDGAMYLLEYGSGFFVESEEARLTTIALDPDAEEPGQPVPPQPVTATLGPGGAGR